MRVYAIKDEELENRIIGYLFCYEKAREGIIELCSDLNEWDAPGMISVRTINRKFINADKYIKTD